MNNVEIESRTILESFVVGNADLKHKSNCLDNFNIFEAIGIFSHKLRHFGFFQDFAGSASETTVWAMSLHAYFCKKPYHQLERWICPFR